MNVDEVEHECRSIRMSREIEYRSYREGDGSALITLFRACGYDPDEKFWEWVNQGCPHGRTIVELAVTDNQAVGHYSVLPRRLSVNGTTVRAGLAIHVAVHPLFRGLAILRTLMDRVVRRCREVEIPFIYGFPNNNVWLVYLKLFQWQKIVDIAALELPLAEHPIRNEDSERILLCNQVHFDQRYGTFAKESVLRKKTHVVKDADYLNWRYADHPRTRYQLLEAEAENGDLAGYVVLKLYEKHGIRYGHVVDVDMMPDSFSLFPRLINKALAWSVAQGVDVASSWMLGQTPFFEMLTTIGFKPTGFSTHVGYRLLDPAFSVHNLQVGTWHIVMGDSDAF